MAGPTEQIKWTAVPNGFDSTGTQFQLSVMASPELSGGTSGTLTDFPDFVNWPKFLLGLSRPAFEVVFHNASGSFSFRLPVLYTGSSSGIPLNPTLWDDLFSGVSYGPPEPIQDNYRNIAIASYPAGNITGFLQGQYAQYDPTKVPTLSDVQNTYGGIADVLVGVAAQERMNRLASERAAHSNGGKRPHANNFSGASMADSFAAQAYYHLAGAGELPPPGFQGPIDFHKALTFIGEHFVLQRALGLVFDIVVGDLGRLQGLLGQGTLYVEVELTDTNSDSVAVPTFGQTPAGITYTSIKPRTQCDFGLNPPVFQAHSSSGNIVNRQLTVNDPVKFIPHAIDFDIGGLRAANFATQIQLQLAPASTTARYSAALERHSKGNGRRPDLAFPELAEILLTPAPPPMIRSNGLTLTEVNRGVNLADRLERAFLLFDAVANSSGAPSVPDLTAEDLVRGYIMDVLDTDDNTWRSTAQRECTYTATPAAGGAVNVTLETAGAQMLRPLDEASAQAPPRIQNSPSDPNTQQANVSEVILRYNGWSNAAPRPGTPLQDSDFALGDANSPFNQMTIAVTATPGSLPPLRFGHTYQMRARVVDICNNFVPLASAVADPTTVTDPMVYGRHEAIGSPDVYQQSPTRPSESLKRLVIRDIDVAGTGGFPALSLRALAPQRVQAPFAEWMGKFDDGTGKILPSAYTTIVPAESAHYPDPNPDPTAQAATITLTSPVPYLPDPVARGGVLTIFDGMAPPNGLAGTAVTFEFSSAAGNEWPHYRPFGLQLTPASAPADAPVQTVSVDNAGRLVTFALTESDTITMNLCCTCHPSDVSTYGLGVYWGNPDANAVAAGQYWSITPTVQLELIYAVQQPLLTPEFPSFPSPNRQQGQTFAPLVAQLTYSPKSTSNIDVKASWGEPVDDPVHPNLAVQGPGAPNPSLRQTANSPVVTLPTPESALASFGTQDYSATDQWTANQEFFDTKHRNVTYEAVATSQFEEFYPPGTNVIKTTQTPVQVNIPSSARPESLHIPYVVPSYGWSMTRSGKTTTSQRSPSSLRVFIQRPWWSSGIDELLGVVTWPDAEGHALTIPTSQVLVFGQRHPHHSNHHKKSKRHARADFRIPPIGPGGPALIGPSTSAIPKDQALYVTDWGADPVFASPALPTLHPTMSAFKNAVHYGVGLDIEEKSDMTVNVAGHPVVFDDQRNLWYCDIAVDIGASYTPMIRLALARFQPNSIPGVELGRIVLVDFMQLEPGRTATVVRHNAHRVSSVTVSGYSYAAAAGAREVAPGAAEVVVERRVSSVHDATVGWEQVGDPIGMSPAGRGFLRLGGGNPITTWTASNIKLHGGGTHRLVINQYEVLPTDNRSPTRGFYFLQQRSREVRLLYQDIIPL